MELGVLPLIRALARAHCVPAMLFAAMLACSAEAVAPPRAPVAQVTYGEDRESAEAQVSRALVDDSDPDEAAAEGPESSEAPANDPEDLEFWEPLVLSEQMTVLHVGDSFAGALGVALNRELEQRGANGILEFKTSTFITTWAHEPRLRGFLRRYDPDLVLISLGANELDSRRPERRARLIRHLVAKLRGRPCVWIAPPLWEGARADLLRVIKRNCAPCAYLDTNELVPGLERMPDGIHPTGAARTRWAKAVVQWLENPPLGQPDQRRVERSPTPNARN